MLRRFFGVFLLSVAMLLLQVTLTRVLSVSLWYHFGFLVISTALLGFGAAGSLMAVWSWLRERVDLDRAMSTITIGFAVSIVVCFWLMQRVPFAPFSLLSDKAQLAWTPLYLLLIATPFFWAGLGIGLLLTRGGDAVNALYASDLAGAGLGCLAVIFVIPILGGSGAIVAAAAIAAICAVVFALPRYRRTALTAAALAVGLVAAAPFGEAWLPITLTVNKASRNVPAQHSEWDAFSKIDVLARKPDPGADRPERRAFRIDGGTAFTGIEDPRPWLNRLDRGETISDPPSMRALGASFVGKSHPRVLIIGSGAGAGTLESLLRGAEHVTAVEINPIIARIVREDPFWGDLFSRPSVSLYAEEGRSFVRRSDEVYDLIVSIHTISNAAMAAGAMDLAENYVLTREAFDDYIDHLAPDGTIYFTRPEAQIPRLFATARAALEARGVTDVARHLYAWRDRPSHPGGPAFSAAFVMRKTPFTDAELVDMDAAVRHDEEKPGDSELLYTPARRPGDDQDAALPYAKNTELDIYRALLTTNDPTAVWAASATELAPATDDKPFFNHRTRWASLTPAMFGDVFRQDRRGRMALEDRPIAELTLIVLLGESAVIAAVLILLPLMRFQRAGLQTAGAFRWLLYFSALGVGFILVEIVLIQRLTLFIGQPALAFATVLGGLLVSSGIGASLSAHLVGNAPLRALGRIIGAVLVTLAATSVLEPIVVEAALGWPLAARLAMTLVLIAPLGITMGMPFPVGLRAVQHGTPQLVPWSWGVNGFFTVIGSVIAVMLGMTVGFTTALVIAGGSYGVALVAARATSTRTALAGAAERQTTPGDAWVADTGSTI